MTSITPGDGAPESGGAVDPFQEDPYEGLWKLLPKLVLPSWYKHVHSGMYHETRQTRQTHAEPDSPAVRKAKRRAARREQRKQSRFARALAGEHTRVAPPSARAVA